MDYKDCIDYVYSFINYYSSNTEELKDKYCQNLERMKIILDNLGYKQTFKVAHIAGTKGKGSTTLVLSKLLISSNYNVGRIVSPHLIDFRERITINDKWIEESDIVDIVIKIKSIIVKQNIIPTTFEIITSIALYYFYLQKVDYACIEVGLGGRLDSTNIVEPSITIITSISYDHMDRLGYTLESIAREKSGIIKDNVPCVLANQNEAIVNVISEVAKGKSSKLYFYKKDFDASMIENKIDNIIFNYSEKNNYNIEIQSALAGSYQAENISIAFKAYRILLENKINIHIDNILRELKNIKINGRLSVLAKNPDIIVDGAHNAYSINCLLENITKWYTNIVLLFVPLKDKDINGMALSIKHYQNYIDKIIIANSIFVHGLKETDGMLLHERMLSYDIKTEYYNDFKTAANYAIEYSRQNNYALLITGSLYTASSFFDLYSQKMQ